MSSGDHADGPPAPPDADDAVDGDGAPTDPADGVADPATDPTDGDATDDPATDAEDPADGGGVRDTRDPPAAPTTNADDTADGDATDDDGTRDAKDTQDVRDTQDPRDTKDAPSTQDTPDTQDPQDAEDPRGPQDAEDVDGETTLRRVAALVGAFLRVSARVTFVGVSLLVSLVRESDRPNPVRRWVLLSGSRWAIVGSLVVSFFLGSLLLGLTNVIGIQESDFVTTMFSTIIAGLFSFVPIVVAVNNVALGRMFDSPDALRERVDGVRAFRARVESMAPDVVVSPTEPAGFLSVLTGTLLERADRLVADADAETAAVSEADRAAVAAFAASARDCATAVRDDLDGTDLAVFDLLVPMMNADYSRRVNEARSLRHRVDDPAVAEGLADVAAAFTALDVARQYFKTLYLQDELARLSRLVAYTGITAFLSSTLVVMIYASGYPPVQHETPLLLLVTLSLAVAFAPFAILFAYVVRLATVIKRTAAPGAFTPPGERPAHQN